MLTQAQQKAVDAMDRHGSQREAAKELGISRAALRGRIEAAERWKTADPAIAQAARAGGLQSS